MINNINKILCIIGIISLLLGGFFLYNKLHNSKSPDQVILHPDEDIKIVVQPNNIKTLSRDDNTVIYSDKKTNPRTKKTEIVITKDKKLEVKTEDFNWFPMNYHVSLQVVPDINPTIGAELFRYKEFGLSINGNIKGLSVSCERDLIDIIPIFKNTYLGVYARFNYTGEKQYGIQVGIFL